MWKLITTRPLSWKGRNVRTGQSYTVNAGGVTFVNFGPFLNGSMLESVLLFTTSGITIATLHSLGVYDRRVASLAAASAGDMAFDSISLSGLTAPGRIEIPVWKRIELPDRIVCWTFDNTAPVSGFTGAVFLGVRPPYQR